MMSVIRLMASATYAMFEFADEPAGPGAPEGPCGPSAPVRIGASTVWFADALVVEATRLKIPLTYVGMMTICEKLPCTSVVICCVQVYSTFPLAWNSASLTVSDGLNPVPVTWMTLLSSGVTVRVAGSLASAPVDEIRTIARRTRINVKAIDFVLVMSFRRAYFFRRCFG